MQGDSVILDKPGYLEDYGFTHAPTGVGIDSLNQLSNIYLFPDRLYLPYLIRRNRVKHVVYVLRGVIHSARVFMSNSIL